MRDYDRIEETIRFIESNQQQQPSLASLAKHVGLSEHHFQRMFRRWAGVTPKTFLGCLTVQKARGRLQAGRDVLQTSMDVGLSGPGRLHDLTVKLEAASPGEIKSRGLGVQITWGLAPTPFGDCLIAENWRGVCLMAFVDGDDFQNVLQRQLHDPWSAATTKRNDATARKIAGMAFERPSRQGAALCCYVQGTEFQVRVWRALLNVPKGTLISYGRLAEHVGCPNGARAVGSALAKNPLAHLIPCHRVIRESGAINNYRWGQTRKRVIIAREIVASETFE